MARSFSVEEAKAVITACRQMREELNEILRIYQEKNGILVSQADSVVSDTETTESVCSQISSGAVETDLTSAEAALIQTVYQLHHESQIVEQAIDAAKQYDRDIAGKVKALERSASSVRWFFSGASAKTDAVNAYSDLLAETNGELSKKISHLSEAFERTEKAAADTIKQSFDSSRSSYREIVASKAKGALGRYAPPGLCGSLLQSANEFTDLYHESGKNGEQQLRQIAKGIRTAADRAAAARTLQLLESSGVETLNQVQSGIRTGILREYGYNSVADVLRATPSALAAIHGISHDSAEQFIDAAKQIASGFVNTTKLNLSTDDKRPEDTALLIRIWKYRYIRNLLDRYTSLLSSSCQRSRALEQNLETLNNNLSWLFQSEPVRRSLSSDYRELCAIMSSDDPDRVKDFSREIACDLTPEENEVWNDFSDHSAEYYQILEQVYPGILRNEDPYYGLPEDLAREIRKQPFSAEGLNVLLRRYQVWGVKYILHQERVLLGDEMGLGKTIQAIAVMVSLKNTGCSRFLIVCPAGVLYNWCREIEEKSVLRPICIHGDSRDHALETWISDGGAAVTSYETLNALTIPAGVSIDLLTVDEAHYIKNPETLRTKNILALIKRTNRILLMTGTALENRVEDMISLMHPLRPSLAEQAKKLAYMSAAPQFRTLISPVYYRRKREDVLKELPEITEVKEWCELLPDEYRIYKESVLNGNKASIRKVSWTVGDPALSSKARRLMEIVNEAEGEGRRILVFSFFLETIEMVRKMFSSRSLLPLTGSVPAEQRQIILDQFEKSPPGTVLPAQIQAGGTGVNIQCASVVVICEPQLKPSSEQQAISRVYRIGQTRKVLVYHLLAQNTIDERIDELLSRKQELFDQFADRSAAADATRAEELRIDNQTLDRLIEDESNRLNLP